MRPGREIDCKLAESVFGYRVHVKKGILFEETPNGDRPLRRYTKEMDAAWEVADKLRIAVIPVEGGQWFALVNGGEGWKSPADFIAYLQTGSFANAGAAVAESPSQAVCLAALSSLQSLENNSKLPATSELEKAAEELQRLADQLDLKSAGNSKEAPDVVPDVVNDDEASVTRIH